MNKPSDEKIGTFYGKAINKMTKSELLDIIIFLAADNTRMRKENLERTIKL